MANEHSTLALTGGRFLTPSGILDDVALRLEDGRITLEGSTGNLRPTRDLGGKLVLPGIVDIHGDAFERTLAPRPGVMMPMPLALAENDAACLAAGITCAFLSATDSFEPGLRGRDTLRQLRAGVATTPLAVDTRLHVRHEICRVEDHGELLEWLHSGQIHLLSTADHLPNGEDPVKAKRYRNAAARRLSLGATALDQLIATAQANRDLGRQQEQELAAAARVLGIPLASHDDDSPEMVAAALARGVTISEFPLDPTVAALARTGGAQVLMGAPNYIRGGSHVAWMGVAEALAADVVDCLCSDYHYPSLFHAPWNMALAGHRNFAAAWAMVSDAPAQAAGLAGRKGRITDGHDGDLLVVDDRGPMPRLCEVWVGGHLRALFA